MTSRQQTIRKGPPIDSVRDALYTWCRSTKRQHFLKAIWASHAILDDNTCELLASVGPIESKEWLTQIIQSGWAMWDELGDNLFEFMINLVIPPLPPPAKRVTAAAPKKRTAPQQDLENNSKTTADSSDAPPAKHAHAYNTADMEITQPSSSSSSRPLPRYLTHQSPYPYYTQAELPSKTAHSDYEPNPPIVPSHSWPQTI